MTAFGANATATFDAAGVAVVEFGPVPVWETWTIGLMSVSATSAAETFAAVYRGDPAPTTFVESSVRGSSGDTSDSRYQLQQGDRLVVRWENGTPGATATAVVQGSRDAVR